MRSLRTAFCAFLILSPAILSAQQQEPEPEQETTFTIVEVMPEFPGGQQALNEYLVKHIHYTKEARKNSVEGVVFVTFVVGADGRVRDEKVLRSLHTDLDAIALAAIRKMPRWKPGTQRGKNVPVQYTLPIRFRLR